MNFLHDFTYHFLKIFNNVISPIDKLFLSGDTTILKQYPPIFIIGPPRSGTTVLYQLMINYFSFAYINNLVGELYGCPILAGRLNQIFNRKHLQVGYNSEHGNTAGLYGPHEFGNFWYRWFPRNPQYADESTLSDSQKMVIKKYVAGMTDDYSNLIIFKNVVHSMRIRALFDIFPQALFLVSKREPVYTAQSIYLTRNKLQKDGNKWWSVQPKEIDRIVSKPPLEQAALQTYYVECQIQKDKENTNPDKFCVVPYERLCQDTQSVLEKISDHLYKHDIRLPPERNFVPQLRNRNEQRLPDKQFQTLTQMVKQLWK